MDSSDKVNCIPKFGIGLKIEEEEAVDSDKIENKKKEEDGIEVNIKSEEIILEDFKLESEPDPSAGCSNQLNWTDPTLGHVVFLPPIKCEMMSEESDPDQDPDQDEDFNLNCEVVLGDCEVTKDKEGETVVKNEPTSSDSYTASGSLQESKISHGQDVDYGHASRSEEAVNVGQKQDRERTSERELQWLATLIDNRKTYCCQICGYKTLKSSHIKEHMCTHSGHKQYKCAQCAYSSGKSGNLKTHMAVHTGLKPFKCTQCSYRCRHSADLKRHTESHSGVKRYSCTLCAFSSSRADVLKRHSMVHTKDKPFCCAHCEFKTVQKHDLIIHLRVHSKDKPFYCGKCPYRSGRKEELKSHLMKKHGQRAGCAR